jgi:hypothetical protein
VKYRNSHTQEKRPMRSLTEPIISPRQAIDLHYAPQNGADSPETAYRRGCEAGARTLALALEQAGLLGPNAIVAVADFVYRALPAALTKTETRKEMQAMTRDGAIVPHCQP